MVDLQTIGVLVTGVSVTIAAIYYMFTLRISQRNMKNTLETRQTQLFIDIWKAFSSKEFQKDKEQMLYIWQFSDANDFFKEYGPDVDPDEHAKFDMFSAYVEGIGVLVRRGMISPDLVYDLMYGSFIGFWEKFSPIFVGLRERYGAPYLFSDVEGLYEDMRRIRDKRGNPVARSVTPMPQ